MHRLAQGGLGRGDADLGVGLLDGGCPGGCTLVLVLALAGLAIARFGPGSAPHATKGRTAATTIAVRRGGAGIGFGCGNAGRIAAAGLLLAEGTEHGLE